MAIASSVAVVIGYLAYRTIPLTHDRERIAPPMSSTAGAANALSAAPAGGDDAERSPAGDAISVGASIPLARLAGALLERPPEGEPVGGGAQSLPLIERKDLALPGRVTLSAYLHGLPCRHCEWDTIRNPARLTVVRHSGDGSSGVVLYTERWYSSRGTMENQSRLNDFSLSMLEGSVLLSVSSCYKVGFNDIGFSTELHLSDGQEPLARLEFESPPYDSLARVLGFGVSMMREKGEPAVTASCVRQAYIIWRESDPTCCPSGGDLQLTFRPVVRGLRVRMEAIAYEHGPS